MTIAAVPPDDETPPYTGEDIDRLLGVKPKRLNGAHGANAASTAGDQAPYVLRTTEEIASRPASKYRIKGLLLAEGIACVFGASGSGKSFLAMDMGIAISDGLEWFGKRVNPADVTWICLEGLGGLERRVKAIRGKYGEQAGERMRFIIEPFNLTFEDDVTRLIQAIEREEMDHGVIVLDTLNASTPGMDENSSKDMGVAIAAAKRIQAECGGLVILVHHSGKDASKGLRGHSSLHGALDTLIEVTRDQDRRTWKLVKSKDGADGEDHNFLLEVVTLGTDEDGDSITSCVIGHAEDIGQPIRRAKIPQGGNQLVIWQALGELLRDSRHFGQASAPATRPCIEVEPAIIAVRDKLATEPKRKTERTRQALTGLVSSGLIKIDSGWLWVL